MQKFILGAYWGARCDGIEESAENARRLFSELAECDPRLAQWFKKGRSRKEALKRPVDSLNPRQLKELLLKGRVRRDLGRDVIEELGFGLSLWNGERDYNDEATVSIRCGIYIERLQNSVVIELPCRCPNSGWREKAPSLLALVARLWRPEWAGIMSTGAMSEQRLGPGQPVVDWMVYVPRSIGAVPLPARIETVNDLGSIVIVQPDPPVGDEASLRHVRQIEAIVRV